MTTPEIAAAASETIKNLAALQEIDDELADIALERGNLPEELEKLGAKISEFELFISEKRSELKEAGPTAAEHSNSLDCLRKDRPTRRPDGLLRSGCTLFRAHSSAVRAADS